MCFIIKRITLNKFTLTMFLYYLFFVFGCATLVVNGHDNIVLPCTTPNNEWAWCVSLFSCPVLMKALGTLQASATKFVKQSACYYSNPGDFNVCCGTLGNFAGIEFVTPPLVNTSTSTAKPENVVTPTTVTKRTTTEHPSQQKLNSTNVTEESHRDFVKRKLLPTRTYCGLQHTDDRFYNETETALDEFPWLADLTYLDDEDDDPFQYLERCSGILISNRYVLTIGTCANDLEKVRLGQYHTNKTSTCVDNPDFPECNEPRYDVKVQEWVHRTNGSIAQHDFALLRLEKKISYSDFVRPICLPFKEPGDPEKTDSLLLTGWGALEESQQVVKKRLVYNVIDDIDKCIKLDKDGLKEASSNVSAICLAPKEENQVACTGDEGGPLMYSHRHQWFAEALVTKVYDWYDDFKATGIRDNSTRDGCSNKLPISAIKITPNILDWIMDNMRA